MLDLPMCGAGKQVRFIAAVDAYPLRDHFRTTDPNELESRTGAIQPARHHRGALAF